MVVGSRLSFTWTMDMMMILIDKDFMMLPLMAMMMTPTRPSMMLGSWDSIRKSQVACKGWFNELDDWYCLVLSSMNWVALFVCYHLKSRDELTKSSAQLFHKINNLLCTRFGWLWWFTTSGEGCGDLPLLVKDFCFDSCLFCLVVREPVVEIGDNVNADPGIIGLGKRILCWEYFSCQNTV